MDSENENDLPEVYSDSFRFTVHPYGVAFTFGTNVPHPSPGKVTPGKDSLVLRMSLEQAKVLAMMLRRNLKNYELQNSLEIALPSQLYTQLGIAQEDWG
ncbi:hypothetical protein ES703_83105 [subsurface metagenome]